MMPATKVTAKAALPSTAKITWIASQELLSTGNMGRTSLGKKAA